MVTLPTTRPGCVEDEEEEEEGFLRVKLGEAEEATVRSGKEQFGWITAFVFDSLSIETERVGVIHVGSELTWRVVTGRHVATQMT